MNDLAEKLELTYKQWCLTRVRFLDTYFPDATEQKIADFIKMFQESVRLVCTELMNDK
ncbi:MAG: hypothetical protein J6M95_00685 [Bacilli bacterium]|nr:hypothetical protein [Bacilli bacterium]